MQAILIRFPRKYGFGSDTCGHIISARFFTQVCGFYYLFHILPPLPFVQIIFILLFGRMMRNQGATKIYLLAVAICSLFNTFFFVVDLVNSSQVFLGLSIALVVLSTVGDAGIFCSIYVLAGQHDLPCSPKVESGGGGSSGPALMETMYALGTMLGPLFGGLIVRTWGWTGLCLTVGLSMFVVGVITALVELFAKLRILNAQHKHSGEDGGCDVDQDTSKEISNFIVQPEPGIDTSESKTLSEEPLNHWKALCRPWVMVSCVTMVASGVSSSWYLSSLESHLSITLQLSST